MQVSSIHSMGRISCVLTFVQAQEDHSNANESQDAIDENGEEWDFVPTNRYSTTPPPLWEDMERLDDTNVARTPVLGRGSTKELGQRANEIKLSEDLTALAIVPDQLETALHVNSPMDNSRPKPLHPYSHRLETPSTSQIASGVLDLLEGNWEGCAAVEHDTDLAYHLNNNEDNHHPLCTTYEDIANTYISSKHPGHGMRSSDVGLTAASFPANCEKPRVGYAEPTMLQSAFHGERRAGTDHEYEKRNVCLHTELAPTSTAKRSFDMDSVILHLRSLAAIQNTIRWVPVRNPALNIQADLHVTLDVEVFNDNGILERKRLPPRDIPHLYFGSIDNSDRAKVFIFFPRLYRKAQANNFLLDGQVDRFVNKILLPSLHGQYSNTTSQYYPVSYQGAQLKARAQGREHRQHHEYQDARQTFATYPLHPEDLACIWRHMSQLLRDPQHDDLRDCFPVVNLVGMKLDVRVDGPILPLFGQVRAWLNERFLLEQVQRVWIDIGAEVCAENVASGTGDRATTYLWKRCCLEKIHERLITQYFGGSRGTMSIFNVGMLRDAACMSVVPPKRSQMRQAGVEYFQFYNSSKTIVDANAIYPFTNPNLPDLAVDSGTWNASATHDRLHNARNRSSSIHSYMSSKERVYKSYIHAWDKFYGGRMECRMELEVFDKMEDIAEDRAREDVSMLVEFGGEHPSSMWAISTPTWVRFMLGNYQKLTSTIDTAIITSPRYGVSMERSQFIAILFVCLRYFENGQLGRYPTLWAHQGLRADGYARWGLGMETSISVNGYGWFMPDVDWEELRFTAESSTGMQLIDQELLGWIGRRTGIVRDMSQVMNRCLVRLTSRTCNRKTTEKLWRIVQHVCFRQYRKDVFAVLKHEMRPGREPLADRDEVRFCWESIPEVYFKQASNVRGNKAGIKDVVTMFDLLFTSIDVPKFPRHCFETKPFRVMFQNACNAIEMFGAKTGQRWIEASRDEFFRYHWAVPYPDGNGTMISTAKGTKARVWWLVCKDQTGKMEYARTIVQDQGRPEEPPEFLRMSEADLLAYINKDEGHEQ
jgi:hypothetical protein